jgi:hypothetical protein
MDACVMCNRNVQRADDWIKCHLWGGFGIFHWRCFGEYLRSERERQIETAVWEAPRNGQQKEVKRPHLSGRKE